MERKTTPRGPDGMLPADRAFAVHFGWASRPRRFTGRVEHLLSGRSARFTSLRSLLAFITRLLDAPGEPSREADPSIAAGPVAAGCANDVREPSRADARNAPGSTGAARSEAPPRKGDER